MARLGFVLHGLVEKVRDIVQVVKKSELPFLQMVRFWFLLEDKMTKDPWLFWRGGWKLRGESLANLGFVLHAPVEKGRRRSTGSKVVQTDKETE